MLIGQFPGDVFEVQLSRLDTMLQRFIGVYAGVGAFVFVYLLRKAQKEFTELNQGF